MGIAQLGLGGTMSRVTMWNTQELRKVSGNAAPMEKNVQEYIRQHPEMEVYVAQDQMVTHDQLATKASRAARRVPIWNRKVSRILSEPTERNLLARVETAVLRL